MSRDASDARFACGAAARAWPYLVALALPAGSLVAVAHVGRTAAELPGWSTARLLVLLVALGAAVVVVRLGGPLHWAVRVAADRLVLERGAIRRELPFGSIAQLGWRPVGSARGALFSAAVVELDDGGEWVLPGMIRDGDALVRALVERAGREDVSTWCEALRLERRMRRATARVVASYLALAAWIVAVVTFVAR